MVLSSSQSNVRFHVLSQPHFLIEDSTVRYYSPSSCKAVLEDIYSRHCYRIAPLLSIIKPSLIYSIDKNIKNANILLGGPTSDMDVDTEEADALPPSFVLLNQDVMNIDSDDGIDSDSTLLGDEILERNIPSFHSARPRPPQVRTPAASFRELHTHTQNGRTFQVGKIFQDQDGDLRRVTSIKHHRVSGRIAIESIQDNGLRTLQTHSYDGRTLKFGKTVEVADAFLRITAILEDRRTGDIFLRGFRFQRTLSLDGVLPFKHNEVAMILRLDKSDHRDIFEQSAEIVELAAVVRIRELIKTNQQFPALSYRETDLESQKFSKQFIYDHCRLVCRWNYVKNSKNEGFLRKMTDVESDEGHSIPQYHLRHDFRGLTTPGGDCSGWLDTEESFDRKERSRCFFIDSLGFHPHLTNPPRPRAQQRRYTFGDGFCGCGGASRGAYGAGLRIAWGFDQDPHAIATYHANFPNARCEGIAVNDFITALNEDYKVDVLHLSPPCQTFSPAHTRPGSNDESNGASFLAIEELLKKVKPRIVTLEETFGLTRIHDHLPWFNAMIQSMTKLGFSVRWKVFNLQDFGLPQPRRRLFLFASWYTPAFHPLRITH